VHAHFCPGVIVLFSETIQRFLDAVYLLSPDMGKSKVIDFSGRNSGVVFGFSERKRNRLSSD
jgi:hypothetical protein